MKEEYEQKLFSSLTGGINVSVPAEKIEDNQSPFIKNMIVDAGVLRKDWGYTLKDEGMEGDPRLLYQFNKKDSVTEIVLITNERAYRWQAAEWQYIPTVSTTVDNVGGYAAGTTTITVDSATGFTDGSTLGIILDDGTEHKTTQSGAPSGSDITIADAIPTGRSVVDGAVFNKALGLSGDWTQPVTAATFPASDILFFTNGKDTVQAYDGSTTQAVPNLVTAVGGGNCYAKIVLVRDNKVVLLNTNENGSDYPQRVRWCATGDYTDWTTADDAGYEDLYGDPYHITAARTLGPVTIIYKEKSIVEMKYVGTSDFVYYFTTMLQTVGAASPWAVVDRGDHHICLDIQKGFYVYAGAYTIQPFGKEIFDELFSSDGILNRLYKQNIFVAYLEVRHVYVALVPTNESTIPSVMYMFSEDFTAWTKREFTDRVTGAAEINLVEGISWTDATSAWNSGDWGLPWNDVTLSAGTEGIFIWGSDWATSPKLWLYGDDYTDDDGADTTGYYTTPELVNPQGNVRVDRVKVKGSGTSITVAYSIDGGDSWSTYGTLAPGGSVVASSVWKQVVGTRIMFRLSGTDMLLSWAAVYWSKEDEE